MPRDNYYRTNTGIHVRWFTVRRSTAWAAALTLLGLAGAGYLGYLASRRSGPELRTNITAKPSAPVDKRARFLELRGKVEVRRSGKVEFQEANRAMRLAQGDMVRTFGASTAKVQLFDGTEYLVTPDSVLLIEAASDEPASQTTRTEVTLIVGTVNLTSPSRPQPGSSSELSTDIVVADIGRKHRDGRYL